MSDDAKKTMLGISPFRPSADDGDDTGEAKTTPAPVEDAGEAAPAASPRDQDSASRAASSVEEHIRAKRKELALKTQRLNLDELDWDVDLGATAGPAGGAGSGEAAAPAPQVAEPAPPTSDEAPEPREAAGGTLMFGADAMARIRDAASRIEDPLPPPPVGADELPEPAAARAQDDADDAPKPTTAQGTRGMVAVEDEGAASDGPAEATGDSQGAEAAGDAEEAAHPAAGGTMVFAAQAVRDAADAAASEAGAGTPEESPDDDASPSPRHGAAGASLAGARTEMPSRLNAPPADEPGDDAHAGATEPAAPAPGPVEVARTADAPAMAPPPERDEPPITQRNRSPRRESRAGLVLGIALIVIALVAVGLYFALFR